MSRRTLTIIDTTSEMREIDLDRIGKRELLLGRNAEQCEVVLADPIISKVQGKFLMIWQKFYDHHFKSFFPDAKKSMHQL